MTIKVIKIGGNVVDNPEMLKRFVADFAALEGPKVLIHGGGVMASQMQKSMGMVPNMVDGRRVTDEETLRIVTMVYAGWCNKNIVALLQAEGCNALGFTGADGNIIHATKRAPIWSDTMGAEVDYGYVGDVKGESVNAKFMHSLLAQGIVPVMCAINHDGKGHLLNTNADTIASSVATALANYKEDGSTNDEVDLIFCFEKNGVLLDKDDDNSVIPHITPEKFATLKEEGVVADGMLPKLANSFKAIEAGVSKVVIKHAANLSNDIETRLTL